MKALALSLEGTGSFLDDLNQQVAVHSSFYDSVYVTTTVRQQQGAFQRVERTVVENDGLQSIIEESVRKTIDVEVMKRRSARRNFKFRLVLIDKTQGPEEDEDSESKLIIFPLKSRVVLIESRFLRNEFP